MQRTQRKQRESFTISDFRTKKLLFDIPGTSSINRQQDCCVFCSCEKCMDLVEQNIDFGWDIIIFRCRNMKDIQLSGIAYMVISQNPIVITNLYITASSWVRFSVIKLDLRYRNLMSDYNLSVYLPRNKFQRCHWPVLAYIAWVKIEHKSICMDSLMEAWTVEAGRNFRNPYTSAVVVSCNGHIDYRIASAGVNSLLPTVAYPSRRPVSSQQAGVKSVASSCANGLTYWRKNGRTPHGSTGPRDPAKGLGPFLTITYILLPLRWTGKAPGRNVQGMCKQAQERTKSWCSHPLIIRL